MADAPGTLGPTIEAIYRTESRRVLATLVRLLGDLDRAEEALQEAFAAAVRQWPLEGLPANPRAWLVSAGRFRAIDALRRRVRQEGAWDQVEAPTEAEEPSVADDQLRLILLCCHPANPSEAQVALTLREVCGLTTEAIAAAYLVEVPTLAKRIVRAKARIRDLRIGPEVDADDLPARLAQVLRVVYLVFHEGYSASSGPSLTRADLSAEALRLGRLLVELRPEAEVLGLLALMLFQESRRAARVSGDDLVLLEDQDRSLWDQGAIDEARGLVHRALVMAPPGPYALQAAIAALHAEGPPGTTDWPQIVALYDLLVAVAPSPVVALNRAVAVSFVQGPRAGLVLVEALLAQGSLDTYHLAHAVRADLHRRLGERAEARLAYEKALYWSHQDTERRFLHRRLRELVSQNTEA